MWLEGMELSGRVLENAASITVVADRESDIYEAHRKASRKRGITDQSGAKPPFSDWRIALRNHEKGTHSQSLRD